MTKRYRDPNSREHYHYRDGRSLAGTPRYASINNHLGNKYILIYMKE